MTKPVETCKVRINSVAVRKLLEIATGNIKGYPERLEGIIDVTFIDKKNDLIERNEFRTPQEARDYVMEKLIQIPGSDIRHDSIIHFREKRKTNHIYVENENGRSIFIKYDVKKQ